MKSLKVNSPEDYILKMYCKNKKIYCNEKQIAVYFFHKFFKEGM